MKDRAVYRDGAENARPARVAMPRAPRLVVRGGTMHVVARCSLFHEGEGLCKDRFRGIHAGGYQPFDHRASRRDDHPPLGEEHETQRAQDRDAQSEGTAPALKIVENGDGSRAGPRPMPGPIPRRRPDPRWLSRVEGRAAAQPGARALRRFGHNDACSEELKQSQVPSAGKVDEG